MLILRLCRDLGISRQHLHFFGSINPFPNPTNITHMPPKRIPVYLLSGFLGSGKTTLLNRLLAHAPQSAVIINEFGATPIDQQLLRDHHAPLSVLAGGCLCCQVKGSVSPLLKNLRMGWEAGTVAFERVIIETSGVANPEPILDVLLRDRWLAARYSLQAVISTVSAVMDTAHFGYFPEAKAQIAWADTIVLTQTDLADAAQVAAMNGLLDSFNPAAIRLTAVNGDADVETLLNFAKPLRLVRPAADQPAGHEFSSVCVPLVSPVPWEQLQAALLASMARYRPQLLRLKGMVYTPGSDAPLLVQGTGDRLYPPTRMEARPSDDGVGRLVFIGAGDLAEVAGSFLRLTE